MSSAWPLIAAWLLPPACGAEAPIDHDDARLAGAWKYVGEVDTLEDGSPGPASAISDTQGQLIHTADGYISVNLVPKARTWSVESASVAELRETIANGTAYSGRYTVDAKAHTVTHVTSVSADPNYQNQRLVRAYSFSGDMLHLKKTFPHRGSTVRFDIAWNRMRRVRDTAAPATWRAHARGARRGPIGIRSREAQRLANAVSGYSGWSKDAAAARSPSRAQRP